MGFKALKRWWREWRQKGMSGKRKCFRDSRVLRRRREKDNPTDIRKRQKESEWQCWRTIERWTEQSRAHKVGISQQGLWKPFVPQSLSLICARNSSPHWMWSCQSAQNLRHRRCTCLLKFMSTSSCRSVTPSLTHFQLCCLMPKCLQYVLSGVIWFLQAS